MYNQKRYSITTDRMLFRLIWRRGSQKIIIFLYPTVESSYDIWFLHSPGVATKLTITHMCLQLPSTVKYKSSHADMF